MQHLVYPAAKDIPGTCSRRTAIALLPSASNCSASPNAMAQWQAAIWYRLMRWLLAPTAPAPLTSAALRRSLSVLQPPAPAAVLPAASGLWLSPLLLKKPAPQHRTWTCCLGSGPSSPVSSAAIAVSMLVDMVRPLLPGAASAKLAPAELPPLLPGTASASTKASAGTAAHSHQPHRICTWKSD